MIPKQNTKLQAVLAVAHQDYEKGLNLYAFSKISDHTISEGLVQDTFVKTWNYLVKRGED